jgi:hypothetical protein
MVFSIEDTGRQIGGFDTEGIVADEELKPDSAANKIQTALDGDRLICCWVVFFLICRWPVTD